MILFVNACVRGADSRTLRLAGTFLEAVRNELPEVEIIQHDLMAMKLPCVDMEMLGRREKLCDVQSWDDAMFGPALDLQRADAVVFAAPYWDLSFPSVLKVWVENVFVRNLTFVYQHDEPIGLCSGKESVYITTSGSLIGQHDWGTGYIRDVMAMLGIPGFAALKAEGLDMAGKDVEAILSRGEDDARSLARAFCQRLR